MLINQQINRSTDQQNCINKHGTVKCSTNVHSLAPISVIANKTNTSTAKYTGQISILNPDELSTSNNVVEAMGQIPGVDIGNDFGRQAGTDFNIRGYGYQSENRVIIKQDGVKRSTSLFSNHVSSFRVDPSLLKQVEVVKGGSSVLHGSGAIGGIVSMKTKNAYDYLGEGRHMGITIGGGAESNKSDSRHMALALAPEQLPIDLLVYGKRSHYGDIKLADGGVWSKTRSGQNVLIDKVGNDERITNTFAKLGWNINDEQRLELSHYKYDEKLNTVWQTLWHRDYGDDPVRGRLKQEDSVLNYSYTSHSNSLIDLSTKLYKGNASYHRKWGNDGSFYRNQDRRWGFDIKNNARFNTLAIEHNLVTGIDYEHRKEDAIFFSNGEFSDFGSFPNYYKDLGIYIQDIMSYNKWEFALGGRYDSFRRGVNMDNKEKYKEHHFSPKVGVSYEIFDGVRLLANYAETFRSPTPNETSADGPLNPHAWYLANPNLQPEIAKEYEMGFSIDKQNLLGDDELYFKATYFTGHIEDMINLKTLPELGLAPDIGDDRERPYAQYQNVNKAKRIGVEVESKYYNNGWSLNAGFSHLKMTDNQTGKRLAPSTDKIYTNVAYTYQPWDLTSGFKVTHWFRPQRDSYVLDFRGTKYYYVNKSYTIVDFKGSWKPKHTNINFLDNNFTLNFGIKNLFNKQRLTPNSFTTSTSVGKERNFYFNVEQRF